MTKKRTTPEDVANALALREAGYTVLSISQKLGISVRTLQRQFSAAGARKGKLKEEIIRQARKDLLNRVTSDETIRNEAAQLINDDLAHSRHLRELVLNASDKLQAVTLRDAALVMRAAAAYSTVIKNTSDTIRHTLRIDQKADTEVDNLPELQIRELTAEEIEIIKAEKDGSGGKALH